MAGSKIKTTITSTVTLGNGYASPLTITAAGAVVVAGYGSSNSGYGIVLNPSSNTQFITNDGLIQGARGFMNYYQGGYAAGGVELNGPSTLNNAGRIFGGAAGEGYGYASTGGVAGEGVFVGFSVQNVAVINSGLIQGGDGAYGQGTASSGGTGVFSEASGFSEATGAKLSNTGTIAGGHGGDSGGAVGGDGGYGVYAFSGGSVTNKGLIIGGDGGYGLSGGYDGGSGGAGLGVGGRYSDVLVTNTGTIMGGAGGGANGQFGPSQNGGAGGTGAYIGVVILGTASDLNNSGKIIGGNGAYGDTNGGKGGYGLIMEGTVTNTGLIAGGYGGDYGVNGVYGTLGSGGSGVYFAGGVLTNAGTISGGYGGAYEHAYGSFGLAVYLHNGLHASTATLVVDPGAVFDGGVLASQPTLDLLELAGTTASTLTGIGTQFEGFSHISIASGAKWQLSGTTAGLAQGETIAGFAAGDSIKITDAAAASGKVSVKKNGVVTIKEGSQTLTINIAGAKKGETDFKFANDTLTKTAAKMAFIAPPSHQAATTVAPASSTPWVAAAPQTAPLTPASAHSFGAISLHDTAREKWSLPVVTLSA
jgi:hypothetical protein